MSAFTFFFNKETFDQRSRLSPTDAEDALTYVTGENKRPLNTMSDGDEVFVLGLLHGQVRLAGRLIVDGAPVSREVAESRLGRRALRDGEIYLVGRADSIHPFNGELTLSPSVTSGLELFTSDDQPAKVDGLRAGRPDPNQFRVPLRLSEASAGQLRLALGLAAPGSQVNGAPVKDLVGDYSGDVPAGFDDDAYRLRAIKSRRGQSRFRAALIKAYGGRCVITRCGVEGLLEAAHITPHAEHTDYCVSNGLLLRSDIHTLFDLHLIGIDARYRVRVSPQIRNSEYWTYNDRQLERFPDRLADNPRRDALERRLARLMPA